MNPVRVVHPDWLGQARKGTVVAVVNKWHADVLFDGWDRPVRAAIHSLMSAEAFRKAKESA